MSASITPPTELLDLVNHTRGMYVHILKESGEQTTSGSCFYAANLLAELTRKFLHTDSAVCGGDGLLDGGYFDENGQGFGHYWAEVVDSTGQRWIVDITADQFGDQPVVLLPEADGRAKYRPGRQALVAAHVQTNWTEVFHAGAPRRSV